MRDRWRMQGGKTAARKLRPASHQRNLPRRAAKIASAAGPARQGPPSPQQGGRRRGTAGGGAAWQTLVRPRWPRWRAGRAPAGGAPQSASGLQSPVHRTRQGARIPGPGSDGPSRHARRGPGAPGRPHPRPGPAPTRARDGAASAPCPLLPTIPPQEGRRAGRRAPAPLARASEAAVSGIAGRQMGRRAPAPLAPDVPGNRLAHYFQMFFDIPPVLHVVGHRYAVV